MKSSELFKTFFLTVMMEGLEQKYDTEISRGLTLLIRPTLKKMLVCRAPTYPSKTGPTQKNVLPF